MSAKPLVPMEAVSSAGSERTLLTRPRDERSKAFYRPQLDVLRFVAFLLVFIGHLNYAVFDPYWPKHVFLANVCFGLSRAGTAGVTLFFCLSAYLITELLLREQDKTGRVHIKAFYIRRILRIWPLYFFFLLLFRPLIAHMVHWEHFGGRYLLGFLLLVGNWVFVFKGWAGSIADPLWSISVEEQFYLVWPLLVSRFRFAIPTFAYGALILSSAVRVFMLAYPTSDMGIWCNTFARLDPFAVGALLAYYLHGRTLRMATIERLLVSSAGLFLLYLSGRFGDHTNDRAPLTYPVETIACGLLLLIAAAGSAEWAPGPFGRVLTYLGRISYGLYVYHMLYVKLMYISHINFFVANSAALLLTIATAAVSYRFLELPFLHLKQRFTYVPSRL